MRYISIFLLLFSLSYAQATTLKTMQNEKRVAYIIGNGDYDEVPIDYAVDSALNMRTFLENSGFEVVYKEDASKRDMIKGLRAFTSLMNKDTISLFYFSGHSIQVRNKNYLIPIDTSIDNEHHVLYEALELNAIVEKMKAAQNRLNIVILNAGHETPFGERYRTKKSGLAKLQADKTIDVIFSSQPNKFSKPYPFTRKLISLLSVKGSSNKEALKLLQKTYKESYIQLSNQEFYFKLPNKLVNKEDKSWKTTLLLGTSRAIQRYLKLYPNGKYSTQADKKLEQMRLDKLQIQEKEKYLQQQALQDEKAKQELITLQQVQEDKKAQEEAREAELKRLKDIESKVKEEAVLAAALEEEKRIKRENTRYIEPVMVLIKAGTFMMGSDDEGDDEKPRHSVSIEKDFYVGRYEVTNVEYKEFINATKKRVMIPPNWTSDTQPAVGISWDDANAYAAWLSELTQKTYRLPTEEEWEYIARAGSQTRYYWGDVHQKKGTWFKEYPVNTHSYAWVKSNAKDITHIVGSKKANAWGLYDITGNVWEWCSDTYTPSYNTPAEEESLKIIRGGSWFSTPNEITLSHRGANIQDFISYSIGFRLVLEK